MVRLPPILLNSPAVVFLCLSLYKAVALSKRDQNSVEIQDLSSDFCDRVSPLSKSIHHVLSAG